MSERAKNYYKNNFLFAGHRMVVPEAGEKFGHTCTHCQYYVKVIGQQETRQMCLAEINAYSSGRRRVPDSIEIMDLMLLLGREALQRMLGKGEGHQMACGTFEQKMG